MKTAPGAISGLARGQQSRVNRGHQIRSYPGVGCSHKLISIVHGRFDHPVVLDRDVKIAIVASFYSIGSRDLLIHGKTVLPSGLECQRGLELVVTGTASLRAIPVLLAPLDQRHGA